MVGAVSPAPRLWDRCVRAGCLRRLYVAVAVAVVVVVLLLFHLPSDSNA